MKKNYIIWILGLILLTGSVSAYFETYTTISTSNDIISGNVNNWYCGIPFTPPCNVTIGGTSEYYDYKMATFHTAQAQRLGTSQIIASATAIGIIAGMGFGSPITGLAGAGFGTALGLLINGFPPNPMDSTAHCSLTTNDNVTEIFYIVTKTGYTTNSSNDTVLITTTLANESSTSLNASFSNIMINMEESSTITTHLYALTNMTIAPITSPNCWVAHDYQKYKLNQDTINKLNKIQEEINQKYNTHQITFSIYTTITMIINLLIELWYIAYWIFKMLAITFVIGLIFYIFIFIYKLIKTLVEA